jgi:site-specific recombinase XerD
MSDYQEAPQILRDFLSYHETIRGHSQRTVDEYFLDLRNFFRYLKQTRDPSLRGRSLDEIPILDVDLAFIRTVTLTDVYDYMTYLSRDRVQHQNSPNSDYGLTAASRARKIATLRSFFNYLTNKMHLLEVNPIKDIDSPKLKKTLPRYLTLDESVHLLESVSGAHQERDYCILTLFLNCGLRISELVGLNLGDIQEDALRVLGKGDKTRIVYLNDACKQALNQYLQVRRPISGRDRNALFLSAQNERISRSGVHAMVKKRLLEAGIDSTRYSAHKLRHTAATLMLQNGVDIRTLQELLGHENLNTTQIYTHIDNEALRVAAKANPLSHVKRKG